MIKLKKEFSSEQREELLGAMKARFEKNMNRHKGLEWAKYEQSWKLILKNCGHSMKCKELAVNLTLLVMIKRQANSFFMIVHRKVLKARRNVCYDCEGQEARKAFKQKDNAVDTAAAIGIELLTEE